MLRVGDNIPSFSCLDQNGQEVSEKSFLGKVVVLFFYPKDSTPGCTKEACDFTENLSVFEEMKVKVYGMSKDSPEKHRKFIENKSLKIDLLSDESTEVLNKFGVLAEKSMFGKKYVGIVRSTLIFDPSGVVIAAFPKVSVLKHVKEVVAFLKEREK